MNSFISRINTISFSTFASMCYQTSVIFRNKFFYSSKYVESSIYEEKR